jgi:integrase
VSVESISGKVTRKTFYGATQGEVVDRIKDYRARNPTAAASSQMRVKEACEFWLAGQKSKVANSSLVRSTAAVGHINQHLGDSRLHELSALAVQDTLRRMDSSGVSVSMQRYVLGRVRSVLRRCQHLGLVATNVAQVAEMPEKAKSQVHPLSVSQVAALLKEAEGDPYEAMYWLALDSGARQGELWALTWPDVDLEGGEVFINKNLRNVRGRLSVEPAKTDGSKRRIKLTAKTVAKLRAHGSVSPHGLTYRSRTEDGLVFTAAGGSSIRDKVWRYGHWMPLLIRAGLTRPGAHGPEPVIRFHDLRHTMATMLLLANVYPKVVQEGLGHASISMTLDTYSHLIPSMQQAATEALDKLLPPLS